MRIGQPNSQKVYHFSQRPSLILIKRPLEVPHAYRCLFWTRLKCCIFHLKIGTVFDQFLSRKGRTVSFIQDFMTKFNLFLPNLEYCQISRRYAKKWIPQRHSKIFFYILLWIQSMLHSIFTNWLKYSRCYNVSLIIGPKNVSIAWVEIDATANVSFYKNRKSTYGHINRHFYLENSFEYYSSVVLKYLTFGKNCQKFTTIFTKCYNMWWLKITLFERIFIFFSGRVSYFHDKLPILSNITSLLVANLSPKGLSNLNIFGPLKWAIAGGKEKLVTFW